jgi:arylsulfatase A-like enzyme
MQRFFLSLCGLLLASVAQAAAPNVVLVYVDDMGYGDLGCYGQTKWKTPHLDQLAKDGVRFTDFYVAQAVCSASRTALLTGCYPNRVSIFGALNPSSRNGIHRDETLISDTLKAQGYATAIFGKWHLGHHPEFLPTRHGFDVYFGLPYSNDMWPNHPTSRFPDLPLIEGEKVIETNPDQSQLTTRYTERAVDFIAKNKDKPFFLYVPHTMPHVPIFVSDKFKGKSGAGLYGDVIEELDWSVGQIREALKKHGLTDKTLVLFSSDNGPWLSYGNHAGVAGPLREGKGTSFEGGVREPFLAAWPGVIPAGTVCKEPAMTIDLLPTIAAYCGAKLPARPIDGLDIRPLLEGKKDARSPHEALFFYWNQELQAVRSGPWKFHVAHTYTHPEMPGGEGKPGKMISRKIEKALFNLDRDVGEMTNVAGDHPEVVARLEKLLDGMREDLGDSATMTKGKGVRPCGQVAAPKQVLLIGQGPDGAHPAGTHEYAAGMRILAKCLADVPDIKVEVLNVVEPWKEGPELMARADGVVLFVAEGARWLDADPKRREALAQVAKRGGGLAVLHWAMGTKEAGSIPTALALFGGCHGGPDRKYQVLEAELKPMASHPVTQGIEPLKVKEELYYQIKFAKEGKIVPLVKASIDGVDETISWGWERPDGGRSFGFSGLHFHDNWKHVAYRRLVAQGVLWTMKLEVPEKGLPVRVTEADLKP